MINRIANVSIYVDDQEKALDFWIKKVGFEIKKDMGMGPNMRWIEVAPKNTETVLVLFAKKGMPNYSEMKPSMIFECSDIEETFKTMKNNGVQFEGEIAEMGFGKFATFYDESGNRFGLRGDK